MPLSTFGGAKKVQAFIMRLVFKMSDATFLLCDAKIERIAENNKGKTINQRMIFPKCIGGDSLMFNYHSTFSFRISPSAASSAVKVAPRYCTQSISRGSAPLLRTERLPAGATLTTLPS